MAGNKEAEHNADPVPEEDHWVQCDRCSKWRRVPQSVADELDDDTAWYCENNPNPQFASCEVAQELTNEEIDRDIQEARAANHDAHGQPKLPAIWQLIKSNHFSHRKRKRQDEDEIMVCHCPPPWRGGDGCGPNCINRMLCIECTADFCPCEEHCNNQMFTRRQYAKLDVRRAGNKGFGLFAGAPIKAGQFIIEYIGEVLEEEEYTRRKEYYIDVGQRHYYFMNVGNGEVIDACRKGNYGRFINHSCEPNCETQKWLVRGELAIGFFALRDIAPHEELTFDYNFERYGDKPMRCYCGSRKCRKFIGGTHSAPVDALADDPEDVSNDPEPVMVREEETDAMVQTMLDKEVGSVQREWDDKLLAKLEQLCKARGIDWHYLSTAKLGHGQAGAHAAAHTAAIKAAVSELEGAAEAEEQQPQQQEQEQEEEEEEGAASVMSADASHASAGPDEAASPAGSLAHASSAQGSRAAEQQSRAPVKAALKRLKQKRQQAESTAESPARGKRAAKAEPPVRKRKLKPLEAARATKAAKQEQQAAALARQASEDEAGPGPGSLAAAAAEAAAAEAAAAEAEAAEAAAEAMATAAAAAWPTPAAKPAHRRTGSDVPTPWTASTPASTLPTKRSYQHLPGMQSAPRSTFKRRSEIDRRLEILTKRANGRLAPQTKQTVIKVLRMFNLCDIAPRQPDASQQQSQQQQQQQRDAAEPSARLGPPKAEPAAQPTAGPSPSSAGSQPSPAAAKQEEEEAASRQLPAGPLQPSPGDADMADAAAEQAPRSAQQQHSGSEVSRDEEMQDQQQQQQQRQESMSERRPSFSGMPERRPSLNGAGDATGASSQQQQQGSARRALLPVEAECERETEARFRARQRARMADLSMLLDVVLDTTSDKLKREYVSCGILNQLQQTIGRVPYTKEYSVVLVKVARLLEFLPLTPDDLYTTRTAHGTFADILRKMASTASDWEVRRRAHQLLKRYPATACKDSTLIQLHSVPAANGRGSYLMALHLPPPQIARLLPLLPQAPYKHAPRHPRDGTAHASPSHPPPNGREQPPFAPSSHTARSHSMGKFAADAAPEAPQYMQGNQPLARHGDSTWDPAAPGNPEDPELAQPLLRPGDHGRTVDGHRASPGHRGGGNYHRPPRASRHGVFRHSLSGRFGQPLPQLVPLHVACLQQPQSPGIGTTTSGSHDDGALPSHHQQQQQHLDNGPPDAKRVKRLPSFDGTGPAYPPPPHLQHMANGSPFGGGSSSHRPHQQELPPTQRPSRLSVGSFGAATPLIVPVSSLRDMADDAPLPEPGAAPSWPHAAQQERQQRPSPWQAPHDGQQRRQQHDAQHELQQQHPQQQQHHRRKQHGQLKPPAWCYGEPADVEELCQLGLGRSAAAHEQLADSGPRSPIVAGALSPIRDMALLASARVSGPQRSPSPELPPGGRALGVEDWMAAKRDTVYARSTPGVSARRLASQELRGEGALPPGFGSGRLSLSTGAAAAGTAASMVAAAAPATNVPVSSLSDMPSTAKAAADAVPAAGLSGGALVSTLGSVPVTSLSGVLVTSLSGEPSGSWLQPAAAPLQAGWAGSAEAEQYHAPGRASPVANGGPLQQQGPKQQEPLTNGHHWATQQQGPPDAAVFEGGDNQQLLFPEVWDAPDANFEAYVADTVKHRLGKYVQPDHPSRISKEDAQMLYRKLHAEVCDKEREAYGERQRLAQYKPIERRKLEGNIKEFVRMSIRRMHAQRAGLAA